MLKDLEGKEHIWVRSSPSDAPYLHCNVKGIRIVDSQFERLVPQRIGTMFYDAGAPAEVVDGYLDVGAGRFSTASNGW